jgi:CRP/FNR family cyclic AMP-dependent transcriptional regulator
MQVEDLGRTLDEHPFLAGIDGKLRGLLVGCAANERFGAGKYLLREGQKAGKFYLIRQGAVAVEVYAPGRAALVVETLHGGDVLGWSWLVPPHRWTFDARAVEDTRVVSLDAACLRRKMDDDPALGYEVMRRFLPVMAHRLQASRLQMLDLYGHAGEAM